MYLYNFFCCWFCYYHCVWHMRDGCLTVSVLIEPNCVFGMEIVYWWYFAYFAPMLRSLVFVVSWMPFVTSQNISSYILGFKSSFYLISTFFDAVKIMNWKRWKDWLLVVVKRSTCLNGFACIVCLFVCQNVSLWIWQNRRLYICFCW